jgi:hypothetical protein
MNEPEFVELRKYKGQIDRSFLRKLLSEIEEDYRKSKNIKVSILYVYSFYIDIINKNKKFFNLISAILEKYTSILGVENVCNLIIESLM